MDEPDSPLGSLAQAAVGQHEMYVSWIDAGFSEEQAFELLKAVVTSIVRGSAD